LTRGASHRLWPGERRRDCARAVDHGRRGHGTSFDTFELPEPVREGVRAAGFTHCTPIQEKTAPAHRSREGRRGSGADRHRQDGAFLITVFNAAPREAARRKLARARRALVIAPTRELVVQIANDARVLGGSSRRSRSTRCSAASTTRSSATTCRPASTS
jgi:superfamily II DNA/RNA helicase